MKIKLVSKDIPIRKHYMGDKKIVKGFAWLPKKYYHEQEGVVTTSYWVWLQPVWYLYEYDRTSSSLYSGGFVNKWVYRAFFISKPTLTDNKLVDNDSISELKKAAEKTIEVPHKLHNIIK